MTDPVKKINALAVKASQADLMLPSCPSGKRATPSAFLRSALFSATQSKDRRQLKEEVMASQSGISIIYTGEQLNQEDLTLWETLVHLSKKTPLGNVSEFTAYSILTAMGLSTGSSDQAALNKGITRLIACSVKISFDGIGAYETSLISSSESTVMGRYAVRLDRALIRLYKDNTWIDWDQRIKLRRKPLAQALHGYYSSHKSPFPIKLETIRDITGSKNKQIAGFKRQVVAALDQLVEVDFLESYVVDSDNKVQVKKK